MRDLIELYRLIKENRKYQKRLSKLEIDYQALEYIAERVRTLGTEIRVKVRSGEEIIISPLSKKAEDSIPYTSFQDRYKENR